MAKLLKASEAADLLGVSPDTLRRWVDDGAVPAIRTMGGQLRLRESDVLTFRQQPQAAAGQDTSASSAPDGEAPQGSRLDPEPPEWQRLSPWEQKRARVEIDLAIGDLMAERRRQRRERKREWDEAQQRKAEEERLAELKRYGLSLCSHSDQRHRLVRLLERFVTSRQVPAYLAESEQRQLVYDRVAHFNRACWDAWRRDLRAG